jgi:hypothetical protein
MLCPTEIVRFGPCVDVYGPRPIATGRLGQDRWSQLLTYIRLPDAARYFLRREPRWVFARFHLNGSETLAKAMPVHTSGSGSDGSDRLTISCHSLQLLGGTSLLLAMPQAAFIDSAGS